MFDDSSITDIESLSSNTSVASILGIKGGLRIRHHTASQKAHVILRRVEASGDSSEDGQDTNAVCFRLFAHKPINVKPGKELLLTIASVDGRFKEGQLVMFEGDLRGKDDDSDHEGTTQVGEEPQVIEEEEEMIPQAAMPPKMRRQWTRRVEEVSPVVFKPPVAHASVGVQTQPITVSSSVQASCDKKSVSIQVKPAQSFASVQTCPFYTSSAVQADPPPLPTYISLDIQTEPILSSFEPTRQELEHTPSSTPMQLASPETSPLITPPSLSIEIPCWIREPSEDMLMSPSDVKVEEIEETLPLSWDAAMKIKQEDALEDTISLAMQHHRPPPPRPVTDMFDVDDSPETWMPLPPPIKSGRAQNPFVSGGFVTDFVGSVTLPVKTSSSQIKVEEPASVPSALETISAPHTPALDSLPLRKQSGSARRRAAKRARLRAQAQPSPSAVGVVDTESLVRPPQGASDPSSSLTTEPIVLQQSLAPRTMSTSVLHRNTTQNAVASSSKLSPHAPPTIPDARPFASISLLPREVTGRAKEKALAAPVKQSRNDSINVPSSSSGVTPPPDPKALVCIPTGPPSNPLSIRPSNSSLSLKLARPSVSAVAAPKPKKLIVVGRGWPFVRAINGTSPASTCTSAADSQPVATSGAALVAYSSPSPSPEASKPVNKWKRIDTAISIGEDESPDDVVLLDPSSPVAKPASLKIRISTDKALNLPDRMSTQANPVEVRTAEVSILSPVGPRPGQKAVEPKPTQPPAVAPARSTDETCGSLQQNCTKAAKSKRGKSPQRRTIPIQLPTRHPLPPKPPPMVAQNPMFPKGIKRERPPSPDLWTAPSIVRVRPQRRRTTRWPTVEWTHSEMLKGDGDLGIRRIAFNSDGSCFALHCRDRTMRIWDNRARFEVARLSHNSQVIGIAWLDDDSAVMTLGEDGVLGKWTRMATNQWEWGRILNVGAEKRAPEDTVCLTHTRDRIAVAFPRTGVKVWVWCKGSWLAQRSIMRTNVTALKFIDGGDALLGGTRDGAVWHCAVPNGTMRVYAFLQSSITSIDINPSGTHALIAQQGGSACLVSLGSQDEKRVGTSYLDSDVRVGALGAVFAAQGTTVLFGTVDGSLLVWDAQKAAVMYSMEHSDGDLIQAVASCDGGQGCVVTGTQQGGLAWWPQPSVQAQSRKRAKVK